jgi:hypothetical protein
MPAIVGALLRRCQDKTIDSKDLTYRYELDTPGQLISRIEAHLIVVLDSISLACFGRHVLRCRHLLINRGNQYAQAI